MMHLKSTAVDIFNDLVERDVIRFQKESKEAFV
jgi:hypothetical protein